VSHGEALPGEGVTGSSKKKAGKVVEFEERTVRDLENAGNFGF